MISSESELRELKKAFETIDVNGDGTLSHKEMTNGLASLGQTEETEADLIFSGIDMDDNGQIEQTEFLAGFMDHRKQDYNDDRIKLAFQHLDDDGSGFIERNELKRLLGSVNEEIIDQVLNLIDINKDGKISLEEFMELMMKESFD